MWLSMAGSIPVLSTLLRFEHHPDLSPFPRRQTKWMRKQLRIRIRQEIFFFLLPSNVAFKWHSAAWTDFTESGPKAAA